MLLSRTKGKNKLVIIIIMPERIPYHFLKLGVYDKYEKAKAN